jgi:formylmethanofuran dehydrogenase subunit E
MKLLRNKDSGKLKMHLKNVLFSEISVCGHSYDQYIEKIKAFHGHVAPGMVIGGFMVDLAYRNLPKGDLFDAICETRSCLPDAIQILTPCTVGNGWLKILNLGRYALSLFEKNTGDGIRVFVDREKLLSWPEINTFLFKLKAKNKQDYHLLMEEIERAHTNILSIENVLVDIDLIKSKIQRAFAVCPICGEGYPEDDGLICLGCQGQAPYVYEQNQAVNEDAVKNILKAVPVEASIGRHALHDMTRIIPGKEKGPAFVRNQKIESADICRLQKLGRKYIYVEEENPADPDWIHEDEAALAFVKAMAGKGVVFSKRPREGKAELYAEYNGMLIVNKALLEIFNAIPGVSCSSRHRFTVVKKGDKLGATRAIPLFLQRDIFAKTMAVLQAKPLFEVLPLRKANVGILVTGSEVFRGLVEDRFIPIISNKIKPYGCSIVSSSIVPDERKEIASEVKRMIQVGADLIITTAGLSVDPDDVTRQGLLDAGATDLLYGMPVLPGNMTLIAQIGNVQIIGVPACGLYHKITSFDLALPRLLAGVQMKRKDFAAMGHGGLCLECDPCLFPNCAFGK